MTQSVCLVLPVPPSVNNAYRNVARGRVRTEAYNNWIALADGMYLQQKRHVKPIRGRCELHIRIPANTRGDATNRVKIAEDFLVSREITGDDRNNWKVTVERDESIDGHCIVTVTALEEGE